MKFKNNLKKIRKSKGITATKLASALKDAGIINPTKQRIAKIEAGTQQMTAEEIQVYSRVLGVPIEEIISEAFPKPLDKFLAFAEEKIERNPTQEAIALEGEILGLCAKASGDAKAKVNLERLIEGMREIFGHMPEQPKKTLKKTG